MNPKYKFYLPNVLMTWNKAIGGNGIYYDNEFYCFNKTPIRITPGTTFEMNEVAAMGGCFYNLDMQPIGGFTRIEFPNNVVTVPAGAYYVRANFVIGAIKNDSAYLIVSGENKIYRRRVLPNYKDDITKDYKLESNQRFYRAELSGKITFNLSVRSKFKAPFES